MNKNIGTIDKGIRIVAGLVLLAYAIWGTSDYTWIGWFGIVPLVTAIIGWCPPYSLLGINTCSVKKSS